MIKVWIMAVLGFPPKELALDRDFQTRQCIAFMDLGSELSLRLTPSLSDDGQTTAWLPFGSPIGG